MGDGSWFDRVGAGPIPCAILRRRSGFRREAETLRSGAHWLVVALVEAGWAPLGVFGLHVVASRVFFLYVAYPPTDIAMHGLGGMAIAYFFRRAAHRASQAGAIGTLNRAGLGAMVFGLTCAAAVFWEFAEYLSDRYLGTKAQLGLEDTLGDMLVGIVGGGAFLLQRFWAGPEQGGR